ncbi:MAG: endonuclease [Thermodesulfovibrio sp.]|nr:endonuclease [Thermodesulfovibrio sp.]
MPTNKETLENVIVASLSFDNPIGEQEIIDKVNQFRSVIPVSDEEAAAVIRSLQARFRIRMDLGVKLVGHEHRPWLASRKPTIDPFFWDRYTQYLYRQKWPPFVVATMDRSTDEILDLFGNPTEGGEWTRRGLVKGDVQSGKTATYTALCNKAADAGYRLIILLTGTMENLRRQTQERLDAGFVGLDSSHVLSKNPMMKVYGVGELNSSRHAAVFTSTKNDFSSILINSLNFTLSAFSEPVLLVVKKHTRILTNLQNWLRAYNADSNGIIDLPVLLIDDESDNASINTNAAGADATKINSHIRSVLSLFTRSTYVGFTATPFANIFIDPDTENEMIHDDLFPKDFIYALDPPTNYFGPETIFANEPKYMALRSIEDWEATFPLRHKKNLIVSSLPRSIIASLQCFVLANVIRDLRGQYKTHRSMLLNVSPYTDVQQQVYGLITEELHRLQSDIRNFSQLSTNQALRNPGIAALHSVWEMEFDAKEFSWSQVQKGLLSAALQIVVKAVNQRSGAQALDYSAHREHGLRVIAVGGNSLSRGLTLEGLCTSYFLRNSQMYDTLLQMGRWFGYRDGYADLCRIWIRDEAAHWYAHISEATDELQEEIRKMNRLNMTPKDFGLRVRAHPDALLVTARNKMRTARTVEREISLSEELLETTTLKSDAISINNNFRAAEEFLRNIISGGSEAKKSPYNNYIWHGVSKSMVADLIRKFSFFPLDFKFNNDSLPDFIENTDAAELETWDVVLRTLKDSQEVKSIAGLSLNVQTRNVELTEGGRCIHVSGRNARVGEAVDEREGLRPEDVKQIDSNYKKLNKNVPGKAYRACRTRPLLLLYMISPNRKGVPLDTGGNLLAALALSLPNFDDRAVRRRVIYKVNVVEWRNIFESEQDEDIEADNVD